MVCRRSLILLFVCVAFFVGCNKSTSPGAEPAVGSATSADGFPVRYETIGKGDVALVFIHCWGCNRHFWDAQESYFAPNYKVVLIDLGGHGESGHDRKRYTVELFGEDVAAVVKKLDLKRAILVGHSLGVPVALEAFKRLGDRAIGVVGVDTFYTGFELPRDSKAARAQEEKFLRPFEQDFEKTTYNFIRSLFAPKADPQLVDNIAKSVAATDKTIGLSALKEMFDWNRRERDSALKRIDGKLRNINGDPKNENKRRHDSVVLIPFAGHFVPQEKPAEFNRVLSSMVEQMSGPTGR